MGMLPPTSPVLWNNGVVAQNRSESTPRSGRAFHNICVRTFCLDGFVVGTVELARNSGWFKVSRGFLWGCLHWGPRYLVGHKLGPEGAPHGAWVGS